MQWSVSGPLDCLTKATTDAAVRLGGVLVAVALGQAGAVVVAISAGVGGVGGHPVTQTTALQGEKYQSEFSVVLSHKKSD